MSRAQLLLDRLLVSCGASVFSTCSFSLRLDSGSIELSRRVDTAEGRERKHGRSLAVAWNRLRMSTASFPPHSIGQSKSWSQSRFKAGDLDSISPWEELHSHKCRWRRE